jgi:methylated-DNA-[protein]-cysteine S-methyltransferase
MEIYYEFIENKDTKTLGAKKVGVAGVVVKGKPRYIAISLATTEKRFLSELKKMMSNTSEDHKGPTRNTAPIKPLLTELCGYFKGDVTKFGHKPHFILGTPFQKEVWKALGKIPLGKTESYGSLAKKIGRPGAARAVGMANHANPVSLVVPCHRVIGSKGDLVGYGGGGVKVKKKLLELERA